MPRGGKREGTGPKLTGRKKKQFYITDEEHALVKEYIQKIRSEKNADK